MLRHIVPHLTSTLLIQSAAVFGYAILSIAALGFVGLGAQVPTPCPVCRTEVEPGMALPHLRGQERWHGGLLGLQC